MAKLNVDITFRQKGKTVLPDGAEFISKTHDVDVKEIENGFIINKNFRIKYILHGNKECMYVTKTWFSKVNPVSISDNKSLADKF